MARVLVLCLAALSLAACGRMGDLQLPPQPQPPINGKPQPDKPGGIPGVKPMMEKGQFLLDPLL